MAKVIAKSAATMLHCEHVSHGGRTVFNKYTDFVEVFNTDTLPKLGICAFVKCGDRYCEDELKKANTDQVMLKNLGAAACLRYVKQSKVN
jgi:hypothetical protein